MNGCWSLSQHALGQSKADVYKIHMFMQSLKEDYLSVMGAKGVYNVFSGFSFFSSTLVAIKFPQS